MHVLICGGGAIGASIAYFLSRRGIAATVIEGTGVACAASGKSGGFLARDWCDGTPLQALACRSFDQHAELAERLGNDWGVLNAPATGDAMAELIVDGTARTTNLSPFDPARLPPLDPARLRQVL